MILLRWLGLVVDLLFLPLRLLARARGTPRGAWLEVTIDGPVLDLAPRGRLWQLRVQKALSIRALDDVVDAMASEPRVRGLFVTLRSMRAGMASASSLRAVLARARAAGKEVVIYLPAGGGTKEVYVASAATRVLLGPTAQLAPLGFRSTSLYLKGALDRASIEPQVFACGEFKSAGENLVRDAMSPAQRAQLERLFDGFHGALVAAIADGRGLGPERARALIDGAPYFGRAAVDAGLADGLAYEDEVRASLVAGARPVIIDALAWAARRRRPLVRSPLRGPVVAVVPVHGAITHAGGLLGELSTDERVTRMLRAVRRDRRVAGVILHVDSPGGSALASDLLHHEVAELARDKPVVACMANVAASGGYYIAAPAKRIIAEATTVTGSIGVVAARVDVGPLLARLGIRAEVVERGARAALLSATGPLDAELRAAIDRELEAMYRAFVGVVAAGRAMPEEDVERLARGRVYTGQDALDVGLVDELGGFRAARAALEGLLDARLRGRVEVVVAKTPRARLDPPRSKDEALGRAAAALVGAALGPSERALLDLAAAGERVLAVSPITET